MKTDYELKRKAIRAVEAYKRFMQSINPRKVVMNNYSTGDGCGCALYHAPKSLYRRFHEYVETGTNIRVDYLFAVCSVNHYPESKNKGKRAVKEFCRRADVLISQIKALA